MRHLVAVLGTLLLASPLACALSTSDIPSDTPVSSLLYSAKSNLAQGNSNDALLFFDAAIARDPRNYLALFQRGAAYLSLGRNALAGEDFDKVLAIKPDFEGALLQRARLKGRSADWAGAKKDYISAKRDDHPDYQELLVAEQAASAAVAAEGAQDWEACVSHAGAAIMVASTALQLRQIRARCRFERGEVQEGISDLQHVLQISPGTIEPHIRISAMLFYALGDTDKGLAQIRQCLHSDPDSKACSKLYKQEKRNEKQLKKARQFHEKRQFSNAAKVLVGDGQVSGLLEDIREDVKVHKNDGIIVEKAPNDLYNSLIEMACELYTEMNSRARAAPFCEETLQLNPDSLHALLHKARGQMDKEEYEEALQTLKHAKEHHPSASQIGPLQQKASTLYKRSKSKDYYKVLGVPHDADERQIKKGYRTLTKKFHPDKAHVQGISKEEAEKKMSAINEAYEVLTDPEKKAMFDRGEDPNSQERQGSPFQGSPFGGGQQFFFQSGHGGGGQRFQFQGGGGGFGGFPFG